MLIQRLDPQAMLVPSLSITRPSAEFVNAVPSIRVRWIVFCTSCLIMWHVAIIFFVKVRAGRIHASVLFSIEFWAFAFGNDLALNIISIRITSSRLRQAKIACVTHMLARELSAQRDPLQCT